jgi:hypothetical protein
LLNIKLMKRLKLLGLTTHQNSCNKLRNGELHIEWNYSLLQLRYHIRMDQLSEISKPQKPT